MLEPRYDDIWENAMRVFKKEDAFLDLDDFIELGFEKPVKKPEDENNDKLFKMSTEEALKMVTRVELIDESGRAYVNWNVTNVTISMQDGNRTMKVFVNQDFKDGW